MPDWAWFGRLLNRQTSASYGLVESTTAQPRIDLKSKVVRRFILIVLITLVIFGSMYSMRGQFTSDRLNNLIDNVNDASGVVAEKVNAVVQKVQQIHTQESPEVAVVSGERVPLIRFPLIRDVTPSNCERRRKEYRELVDGRILANTLDRNEKDELTGFSFELAKSQALFSETCWTVEDRYAHYTDQVDVALNKCNELAIPANRTTIVLALEYDVLFTADATSNLRALIIEVGWYNNWDVILLQNIKKHEEDDVDKIPHEFRDLVIKYTNEDVFEGFPESTNAKNMIDRHTLSYSGTFDKYTSTFYQFAQVAFFETFPEYGFAYFLESHVRSTGNYQELFSAIEESRKSHSEVDLLTLDPILATKPTAYWKGPEAAAPESFYKGKHVVHGISRRLATAMNDTLHNGVNAPHEAFLPAVAIKHNFDIFMFAHPIMKRINGLLFEAYTTPTKQSFTILGLDKRQQEAIEYNADGASLQQPWQHGGTFDADSKKWVQDQKQTKWIDELYQNWKSDPQSCLPGLLVYPVSGR